MRYKTARPHLNIRVNFVRDVLLIILYGGETLLRVLKFITSSKKNKLLGNHYKWIFCLFNYLTEVKFKLLNFFHLNVILFRMIRWKILEISNRILLKLHSSPEKKFQLINTIPWSCGRTITFIKRINLLLFFENWIILSL